MSVPAMLVSKVLMPERGVFLVRVDDELTFTGAVKEGTKGRYIVSLDYGEDVGSVIATERYDSAVHGSRIPGFRLVRLFAPQDERTLTIGRAHV